MILKLGHFFEYFNTIVLLSGKKTIQLLQKTKTMKFVVHMILVIILIINIQ